MILNALHNVAFGQKLYLKLTSQHTAKKEKQIQKNVVYVQRTELTPPNTLTLSYILIAW